VRTWACLPAILWLGVLTAFGQAAWQETLARMPLPGGTNPVERNNVIRRLLEGLQSNDVVKAIVVLPAVSDDLYLINRDKSALNLRATNLWQAIVALTNATETRATFRSPCLLIHRDDDALDAQFTVKDAAAAQRLKSVSRLPRTLFSDAHWEKVRPVLNKALHPGIHPWGTSPGAWHFARHNLAAWGLSDWEILVAVSLTGKTAFTVEKRRVTFEERSVR